MRKPAVFGFYGKSDTGKTTLIEKIIKKLTQDGYKIATIKKTDKKIGVDEKGKDTWKHSSAGAQLVVLSSPCETDFIVKEKMQTKDIIQNISEIGCYDIVFIEGARDPSIPKIRLGDIEERDNTIGCYKDNFEDIFTLIKKEIDNSTVFNQNICVTVNEKAVPLTEFPAKIIKNGIVGMLKSLKGVGKIDEVKIRFKN
ncbi:MAG: molybdopterin-guanine dinucleotide biosynthesis protein B [Thermoplasmatales archaeon]|nr:MAG: molybdopterin-guanine dinucleotide biosynthesis protein B [Thermoplasmatales archaeon]